MSVVEREGGDITAADMVYAPTEPSLIQEYFNDAIIFITGATGFLGKLLVEKLLRVCNIRQIYVLIRPKYGKTSEERFHAYFDDVVFDRLRRENYEAVQNVVLVDGDCAKPRLGLNDEDLTELRQVNCVFHCASTAYFDDKLVPAVMVNIGGVTEILSQCQKMPNLKSIICMSTVYTHSAGQEISEAFYNVPLSGNDLLTLIAILKEPMAENVASVIIGNWPNVYTFTKAVTEDVIKKNSSKLPLAIVRHSLVIGTAKEPVSGWVNSFYGASGIFAGISLGLVRTLHVEPNNLTDLVPADYVVNCMLAASYDIALKKSINANDEVCLSPSLDNIPIYNYVSTQQKAITWRTTLEMILSHIEQVPLSFQIRHAILIPTPNKYLFLILQFLLHTVPGYFTCFNETTQFYTHMKKFLNAFTYFTLQRWIFRNSNVEKLWEKLNVEDRKYFEFGMHNFDWDLYFRTNVRGLRVYLLKDPIDTIPAGQTRLRTLKILHYGLVVFVSACFTLGVTCTFFNYCITWF
ncbi:hypothetical protein RN001_010403 [Aquatica leii]|uniref:Fatty acyl-CoA reductase n=1 Tax=Aquatica leii TaxID=1421715 RepID=A0AAN7PWC5_9COLE|nr:hypothetical protein RN001_010403 [Aquatica leii]